LWAVCASRRRRIASWPISASRRVAGLLAAEQPKLVVVGASLMLHPHRLAPLVDLVPDAGARPLYDASHVAGPSVGTPTSCRHHAWLTATDLGDLSA
jgi:hypothetical protein